MNVRSALHSLAIVALAFASIGGECVPGGTRGPGGLTCTERCSGATPVKDGTTLTAQDTAAGCYARTSCELAVGPALFYKATIPAGATLTGKTTGRSGLLILSDCAATICLASDLDVGAGAGVTVAYMNATSSPLDVILELRGLNTVAPGAYGLTVSIK